CNVERIKDQKDQHGQGHTPPRPPPEAQDFPQGTQHGEPTEQPRTCRLDRLLTLVARPAHATSYAVGEAGASLERLCTGATCPPLCRVAVVVLQQPTEPFAAPHGALTRSALAGQRKEQHVALTLVIPLMMEMRDILRQRMAE